MTEPVTAVLRIFSYLPNPRVWKALIAARLCGVTVDVIGDRPASLGNWLWDFAARELAPHERVPDSRHARQGRRGFAGQLFKTDAFLQAQPFGTVPAAFSPDGAVGIFESNSILRAVARCGAAQHQLYGNDAYEASRIDSFLDANLVFAREAQAYLLDIDKVSAEGHRRMTAAWEFYAAGVESALQHGDGFLVGAGLSIADLSVVCDFAQFLREGHYVTQLANCGLAPVSAGGLEQYPRTYGHMLTLAATPAFAEIMGTYLDWFRRAHGAAAAASPD